MVIELGECRIRCISTRYNLPPGADLIQAREDVFNPAIGLLGFFGHDIIDVGLGNIFFILDQDWIGHVTANNNHVVGRVSSFRIKRQRCHNSDSK